MDKNQEHLFAIDNDANDDQNEGQSVQNEMTKVECVHLNVWFAKPDMLSKFKCFLIVNKKIGISEWVLG